MSSMGRLLGSLILLLSLTEVAASLFGSDSSLLRGARMDKDNGDDLVRHMPLNACIGM
jgi:hypothetical protein